MSLTKPTLDNLRAAGTTVGDVYFPQTKLLLPFDGANGAQVTSDSSNENNTVTFVATAQISTAQSKFGGSSLLLDGNSDYVTVTNSDLNLGGVSFTIEFWTYLNGGLGSFTTFYSDYSGSTTGIMFSKTTGNVLGVNLTGDGHDITGTTALATGQWYHCALSGNDGSYKLFLNGTQEGSTYTGSSTNGSSTKRIGDDVPSGGGRFINGYIDGFRITKGFARYTSNFTPPTSAHLTSAGDVNKQILINSTADGVAIGTGGINQARIAKAWVNFNGTGTVAIRGSYNVSSITDNGAGIYTVNFSSNMSDANYAVSGSVGTDNTASAAWVTNGNNQNSHTVNNTTSSCRVSCAYQTATGHFDPLVLSVNIFGN